MFLFDVGFNLFPILFEVLDLPDLLDCEDYFSFQILVLKLILPVYC